MKLAYLLLILPLFSCKKDRSTIDSDHSLPKDFISFYEKFQEDSIYQMDHITFPLEGMPSNDQGTGDDVFKWEKNNWTLHKKFDDPNNDFVRDLFALDSTIVIERIRLKNNEFGMERRYAKSGGQWFLIYYAAMNKLKRNSAEKEDALN